MKKLMLLATGLVCVALVCAAETAKMPTTVTLKNGATLRGVSVVKWNTDSVVLKHVGGVDRVRFDALSPETLAAINRAKDQQQTVAEAPTTYAGEIFITTKGRDNVVLGSTKVSVYSGRLKGAIISGMKQAEAEANSMKEFRSVTSLSDVLTRLAEGRQRVKDSLPVAAATAYTDSKGAFSVNVKPKDFGTIVVFSDRMTGGDTERYVWALEQEDITDPKRIVLGNHNMLSF